MCLSSPMSERTYPMPAISPLQGEAGKPPVALLDRLKEVFGFEPPRQHGVDTVGAIRLMLEGRGRVFFALGGNFAAATPAPRVRPP